MRNNFIKKSKNISKEIANKEVKQTEKVHQYLMQEIKQLIHKYIKKAE